MTGSSVSTLFLLIEFSDEQCDVVMTNRTVKQSDNCLPCCKYPKLKIEIGARSCNFCGTPVHAFLIRLEDGPT